MQPSFSEDGSRAALCLSGSGNSEIYMYDLALCKKMGKRVFTQLTHNKGSNVSPCLLANDDLIFCSDFQTGSPQIYYRYAKTQAVKRLTSGKGYCAAPAHCPISNKIAYTRYANGTFQLFTLSLNNKNAKEQQLTFNAGDKLEPTWSACGKYLAFTYANLNKKSGKRTHQIAVLNTQSNIVRVLTDSPEPKSFPTWTGRTLYI
jgi:Tol biopolymer transport system component